MYKVLVIDEAKLDIKLLPDDILQEVKNYLYKYQTNPHKYSSKLYDQGKLKLKGYRKTYVANATYRIVFKVEDGVAKIVEVVAVGKREAKEVYRDASSRIGES